MSGIELSPETKRRLDALFAGASREKAAAILRTQLGPTLPFAETTTPQDLERIRFAALKLSNGDLSRLQEAAKVAGEDWRDVLVAAGFADDIRAHESWFPGGHAA